MKLCMAVSIGVTACVLHGSVVLESGETLFSEKVIGSGGISCRAAAADGVAELFQNVYPVTDRAKLFLAGRRIEDIEPWAARLDGAAGGTAWARNLIRTNGVVDVDFQREEGDYIKAVKVYFYQQGDDIYCRAAYARAGKKSNGFRLGASFDAYAGNSSVLIPMSTYPTPSVGGYGVPDIYIRPAGNPTVASAVFAGGVAPGGALTLDTGVSAVVTGETAYAETLLSDVSLTNAAVALSAGTPGSAAVFTNRFSGVNGKIVFVDRVHLESEFAVTVETADQASFKTARTVAPNRSLSDLVDLRVRKIGMNGDDNYNGIFVGYWHTLPNGDRRCQVQYNDGSYLKCAVLVFSRSDNGIQVKALKCIYRSLGWYGDKTILDDDLYARLEAGKDDGTKDTNNAVYYWISDMDLMFSVPERSELIMSGPVTCSPCEISVSSGVDAAISNSAALPPGSVINVGPDARASVCRSNAGTLAEVRVEQGGRFTVKWWDAVDAGTRVHLYGGEINVDTSSAATADSGTYVNHIDFHDGARLFSSSDRGVRVGGNPACYRVSGESASRVDCPLLLVKKDSCPFVIDVADVTGDGEVDFTLAGALKDQGNSTKGHAVRKEGGGTLLLTAAASATGPLTVVAGVLRLGAADAAKTFASLKLEGGALASDAAQKLPALNLAGNAVLDCSSSGAYSFGDSSSVAWTDGARLEINSFRQGAVRFGTSSDALTLRQMRQLRIGGRSVRLDGEGYVVPKDPLVIFLR